MNTPKRPEDSSNDEETDSNQDSLTERSMIDFASALDDFIDEEVVDRQGKAIGTLACYWPSLNGLSIFLGIKLNRHESVRIVPGHHSQLDDRNACIRLGFDAADIESAPGFDCDTELDAALERTVKEHFGMLEGEPPGGPRYSTRKS